MYALPLTCRLALDYNVTAAPQLGTGNSQAISCYTDAGTCTGNTGAAPVSVSLHRNSAAFSLLLLTGPVQAV